MILRTIIALLLSGILVRHYAFAAELTVDQYSDVIWEAVQNESSFVTNEITREGQFAGCELLFNFPYRDYRSQDGAPLMVSGSVNVNYVKGKTFGYLLKIVPIRLSYEPGTESLLKQTINPAFAKMNVNGTNIDQFKQTFECERGTCVVYVTKSVEESVNLAKTSLQKNPFDAELYFSLAQGGMDQRFTLSGVGESKTNQKTRQEFSSCLRKVVGHQISDLKESLR